MLLHKNKNVDFLVEDNTTNDEIILCHNLPSTENNSVKLSGD